jgi:hypothetical protein
VCGGGPPNKTFYKKNIKKTLKHFWGFEIYSLEDRFKNPVFSSSKSGINLLKVITIDIKDLEIYVLLVYLLRVWANCYFCVW